MITGSDKIVQQVLEPRFYSDLGVTHNLLTSKLYARRFFHVKSYELDEFLQERQEPDVILIDESLPGIAIVRKIATTTGEVGLLHQVVAMSNPESSTDEFERHNYTISFELIPQCGYLDCPLCYREIEILQQSELLTVGKSRYDPDVLEATKRYRDRRKKNKLRHLKLMRLAMQAMALTHTIIGEDDNNNDV